MSIMPDRWIRRMAHEHGMIEPFVEAQKREGVISYGLSSYGYDARVADEFKIFTNVDNAVVDPKNFAEHSFVDRSGRRLHHPAQLLRARAHGRVFPHPARRAGDLPRQVDLCPLRHHRERDAAGARMGRPRHARDLATPRRCPPRSTPTRASASSCSCRATSPARSATPTRPANTCASAASRCPKLYEDAAMDRIRISGGTPLKGEHRHQRRQERRPAADGRRAADRRAADAAATCRGSPTSPP